MVPRANCLFSFGSFQAGVEIVLHLVIWGRGFFETMVRLYLDVCWILIMEELKHFLRYFFGAARWWLNAQEFALRCLMDHEHPVAFLARVLQGISRPLLRPHHLSLGHAAPLSDAHRILFLLQY